MSVFMKKILYVVSSPDMNSFASGILVAAMESSEIDPYAIIFIHADDIRSKEEVVKDYGIFKIHLSKIEVYRYPDSKVSVYLFQKKYVKLVRDFATDHQLKIIHFLTQDTMLAYRLYMLRGFKIYYTVHDLEHHEAKLSWFRHLKRYLLLTMRDKWIVRNIDHLVTSGKHQVETLKSRFPEKYIYEHQMPGLITPGIISGTQTVAELEGINNYVLFFGRIEYYKGIEKLYQLFLKKESLPDIKLVIAGKGLIYFNRELEHEEQIVFINRFIADEEMNDLFQRAKLVVLPYTSATQSAITSLSYHFAKPMVVSDIPGLTDTVIDGETALLFNPKSKDDLLNKLKHLLEDDVLYRNICLQQLEAKEKFYSLEKLVAELDLMYANDNLY